MSPFLIVLFGAFALVYGTIVVLLLRRPLIGRIAVREAARRPGQTTLIVAGLMIAGAAIFSTQLLEDSQNQWNRSAALKTWGHDDIEVTGGGALFDSGLAQQLAGDSSVNTSGATFQNALVATGSVIDLDRNLGKPGVQVTGLDLVAEPHFGNFVLTTGRASVGAELAAGGLFVTQPLQMQSVPGLATTCVSRWEGRCRPSWPSAGSSSGKVPGPMAPTGRHSAPWQRSRDWPARTASTSFVSQRRAMATLNWLPRTGWPRR